MPFSLKLRYMRPRVCRPPLKFILSALAGSADRRRVKKMKMIMKFNLVMLIMIMIMMMMLITMKTFESQVNAM